MKIRPSVLQIGRSFHFQPLKESLISILLPVSFVLVTDAPRQAHKAEEESILERVK